MATTDKVEWILLDTDLTTQLGILPAKDGNLYLEFCEPGSGQLTIPLDSAAAGIVTSSMFCECFYRGSSRGGFFVDNIKQVDADSSEGGGRWLTLSGRGALALLEDAIVWDDGSGAARREFSGLSFGAILKLLIDEAQARGALSALAYDFNATDDSDSVAWTDTQSISFDVGTSLLDVLRTVVKTGTLEVSILLSSGTFNLSAYSAGIGTDKTSTIYLRIGTNCVEVGGDERGDQLKNVLRVKYRSGYLTSQDATSITAYRRREDILNIENAQSEDSATSYASAKLDTVKDPRQGITVKTYDGVAPYVFEDYIIGDTVTIDKLGTETTYRVLGLQVDVSSEDYANVTVELNNLINEQTLDIQSQLDWLLDKWNGLSDQEEVNEWLNIGTPNGAVYDLKKFDAKLYVAGNFTAITGVLIVQYVAVYDTVSKFWDIVGDTSSFAAFPKRIEVIDYDDIWAMCAQEVWHYDGSSWTREAYTSNTFHAMAYWPASDFPGIYIAGDYITFNGSAANQSYLNYYKFSDSSWNAYPSYLYIVYDSIVDPVTDYLVLSGIKEAPATTYHGNIGWLPPDLNGGTALANDTSRPYIHAADSYNDVVRYVDADGDVMTADISGWSLPTPTRIGIVSNYNTAYFRFARNGSDVYLLGDYDSVSGITGYSIVKRSGGYWYQLPGGGVSASGTKGRALAIVFSDSAKYIGGLFDTAGTLTVDNLTILITSFQDLIDYLSSIGGFDMAKAIHGAPVSAITDSDEFGFWEDVSNALRKITWANIKATLKTYFDALYDAIGSASTVQTNLTTHINDTTDAHDASAISIVDSGGYFTGIEVEAALQEVGVVIGDYVPSTGGTFTGQVSITNTSSEYGLYIDGDLTGATQYGMYLATTLDGSSSNVGMRFSPTSTSSPGSFYGVDARPQFASTSGGALAVYYGILGIPVVKASATQNVTNIYGGFFRYDNQSTGGSVIATGYGLYISNPTSTGTITTNYGLFIASQLGGSTDYAIYTQAGDVRLMASSSDKLGFHGSAPVAKQTVTGSRGGNAALTSLLSKLATLGIITDSST